MTETEQLKQNIEKEVVKQRSEDLTKYVLTLMRDLDEAYRWVKRGSVLDLFCLTMFMVATGVALFTGLDYEVVDERMDWMFVILTCSYLRTMSFIATLKHVEGKLAGTFETLKILGMAQFHEKDDDGVKKTKKRKSLFPRFKEFFERVGQTESKEAPQGV